MADITFTAHPVEQAFQVVDGHLAEVFAREGAREGQFGAKPDGRLSLKEFGFGALYDRAKADIERAREVYGLQINPTTGRAEPTEAQVAKVAEAIRESLAAEKAAVARANQIIDGAVAVLTSRMTGVRMDPGESREIRSALALMSEEARLEAIVGDPDALQALADAKPIVRRSLISDVAFQQALELRHPKEASELRTWKAYSESVGTLSAATRAAIEGLS